MEVGREGATGALLELLDQVGCVAGTGRAHALGRIRAQLLVVQAEVDHRGRDDAARGAADLDGLELLVPLSPLVVLSPLEHQRY